MTLTLGISLLVAGLAIAVLGVLVYGSASIHSGFYVKAVCKRDDEAVSLTFDDGPDPEMTPKVLEVLRRHGVKATFFVIGEKVQAHPEIVRQIVEEGHSIGSHSWSHDWRTNLGFAIEHSEQIRKALLAIKDACGVTSGMYRPPMGVTTPHLRTAVRWTRVKVIGWNVRSFDTVMKRSREEVAAKVIAKTRPGSIILLHDRLQEADRLADMIISGLKEKGFEFKAL